MSEFLDKVKQGISKGVTTARVKSKELIDVTRLKNQISILEKKKQDLIEELGGIVYAMFLKNNIDVNTIQEKGSFIKKIDGQMDALRLEIADVQKKAKESLSENISLEKVPASDKPVNAAADGSFCGQCHEELEAGAKFCANCGEKV